MRIKGDIEAYNVAMNAAQEKAVRDAKRKAGR